MRHQTLRKTLVVLLALITPAVFAATHDQTRITETVESLAPETSGVSDVFFVGFAGFGDQQVFRKEEQFARQVIAKRYGSESRSVDLVNDTSLPDTYAAASLDNLRLALSAVGTKMNVDEDVLVLMLTSHGYPKEGIAVVNNDTDSPPLHPKDLRKALDASGIKWRIVIVSACYAGAFIKPLRNDTTLIVTAADARHSSFGCEDERELTYFGEAFFRDALPKSRSIEAAFTLARNIVRTRESSEGMVHSNPQLYVGKQMRAKLVALESRSP